MSKKPQIVIGIDPGVKTGFAVYSRRDRCLLVCMTVNFWGAHDMVKAFDPLDAELVVENPNLNASLYRRQEEYGKSPRERIAQNIGMNKAHASLLIERFESWGYKVHQFKPVKESGKWDAETFKRITRFEGRVSEHARDAARVCFGL